MFDTFPVFGKSKIFSQQPEPNKKHNNKTQVVSYIIAINSKPPREQHNGNNGNQLIGNSYAGHDFDLFAGLKISNQNHESRIRNQREKSQRNKPADDGVGRKKSKRIQYKCQPVKNNGGNNGKHYTGTEKFPDFFL